MRLSVPPSDVSLFMLPKRAEGEAAHGCCRRPRASRVPVVRSRAQHPWNRRSVPGASAAASAQCAQLWVAAMRWEDHGDQAQRDHRMNLPTRSCPPSPVSVLPCLFSAPILPFPVPAASLALAPPLPPCAPFRCPSGTAPLGAPLGQPPAQPCQGAPPRRAGAADGAEVLSRRSGQAGAAPPRPARG